MLKVMFNCNKCTNGNFTSADGHGTSYTQTSLEAQMSIQVTAEIDKTSPWRSNQAVLCDF